MTHTVWHRTYDSHSHWQKVSTKAPVMRTWFPSRSSVAKLIASAVAQSMVSPPSMSLEKSPKLQRSTEIYRLPLSSFLFHPLPSSSILFHPLPQTVSCFQFRFIQGTHAYIFFARLWLLKTPLVLILTNSQVILNVQIFKQTRHDKTALQKRTTRKIQVGVKMH